MDSSAITGTGAETCRQGSGLFAPGMLISIRMTGRITKTWTTQEESSGEVRRKTVKSSNCDQLASLEAVPTRVLTELWAGRIESEPSLR